MPSTNPTSPQEGCRREPASASPDSPAGLSSRSICWRAGTRVNDTADGARTLTLATLNRASREEFTAALGAVFEHSPWVAAAAWPAAPFATIGDLHTAMVAAVRSAPEEQRLALIRAH